MATSHPVPTDVYPDAAPFDPQLVEARLALGMVSGDQMPPLA